MDSSSRNSSSVVKDEETPPQAPSKTPLEKKIKREKKTKKTFAESYLIASFLVPLGSCVNICLLDLSDCMCSSYYIFFCAEELHLVPIVLFSVEFATFLVSLISAKLAERLSKRITSAVTGTIATGIVTGSMFLVALIPLQLLTIPGFVFLMALHVIAQSNSQTVSRSLIARYSRPCVRQKWNSMGVEGGRNFATLIGYLIGGFVSDKYGFTAMLIPTAIVTSICFAIAMCITLIAPPPPAVTEEESILLELGTHCMGVSAKQILIARNVRRQFRRLVAIRRINKSMKGMLKFKIWVRRWVGNRRQKKEKARFILQERSFDQVSVTDM